MVLVITSAYYCYYIWYLITEKSIVLNMLRLAASGVISYSGNNVNDNRKYHSSDQQQKGLWQQNQSHANYRQQPHPPVQQDYSSNNEDPIVQVARQLSHLASRQGHNVMDEMYQSPWQHQRMRPRSASMEQHPMTNGHTSKRRTRSYSANTVAKATSPPPPVRVTVTKQQLQEPQQQSRPPTRLRYVSTWK